MCICGLHFFENANKKKNNQQQGLHNFFQTQTSKYTEIPLSTIPVWNSEVKRISVDRAPHCYLFIIFPMLAKSRSHSLNNLAGVTPESPCRGLSSQNLSTEQAVGVSAAVCSWARAAPGPSDRPWQPLCFTAALYDCT